MKISQLTRDTLKVLAAQQGLEHIELDLYDKVYSDPWFRLYIHQDGSFVEVDRLDNSGPQQVQNTVNKFLHIMENLS